MKKTILLPLLAVCFITSTAILNAASWGAFTGIAGKGNFSSTIMAWSDTKKQDFKVNGIGQMLAFSYGMTDKTDLYFGAGMNGTYSYIMPRVELFKNNVFGLRIERHRIRPQYHATFSSGAFSFEFNTIGNIYWDGTPSSIGVVAAPVFTIGKVSLFLELDPGYSFAENIDAPFSLSVIPGTCIGFGGSAGYLSLGVQLNNTVNDADIDTDIVAWYWFPISKI